MDREKQHFIAESSKTLDLIDNNKSEIEGDGLWIGCGTVDKSGRLCEKTIELPPSIGRSCSCFTVTDLVKDERFNQLPFVSGPPFFKFYSGTPLTTKKGVNIGSLFILDDVVRPPLSADQETFLGTIAQTVMKHIEITSEAEERKKVMRMSLGAIPIRLPSPCRRYVEANRKQVSTHSSRVKVTLSLARRQSRWASHLKIVPTAMENLPKSGQTAEISS